MASQKVKPLSQKAINSIEHTGYLNVWEGAVRSGKTVASALSWLNYVAASEESYFIMSGKTIATLYRNVIGGDFGMVELLGSSGRYRTDREGNRLLEVYTESGTKTCYCFGANDEKAYSTLRGVTAGGWYADEINLQPRSFVEEAFRRTIVSEDRKHFWTLNPDNPHHWIYTDYLDKYEDMELDGFYLWFFTLEDNLALPKERREELKAQYSGIFYRRYILGERCIAEGAVYDQFSEANIYDDDERPYQLELLATRTIAVDYGTRNPCVYLDIYDDGKTLWVDNEYRWDSIKKQKQKTDSQYANDMQAFMGDNYCEIVVDPSAASFMAELKTRSMFVSGAKNDVLDGIRATSSMLENKTIKISRNRCKGLIEEMRAYAWDEKAALKGTEQPIKQEDHAPDALRYMVNTKIPKWRTGAKIESVV